MIIWKSLVILGLFILILIVGFVFMGKEEDKEASKPIETTEVSLEEKQQIEAWILEQGLNQYGDSKDTVYMGGTPLFDERTGQGIDKYEYILMNHPDMPWKR